ncbi:MAG: GGDEF domain-containing protein [Spirochaetaceae bacterium]|nr:MAG: GGDEF domain-containing protein [Spirochaetaceae bacterium]
MENQKRHIITGYALFSLFFLGGLFAYTLFRLNLFSIENSTSVETVLESLKNSSADIYKRTGSFDNPEMDTLFKASLENQPRVLSIVLYSKVKNIIYKAVGKSKLYLDNAFSGNYSSAPVYNTPFGTNIMEKQFAIVHNEQNVPLVLGVVYIDLSIKDMHAILWEVFYILAGFFGMTLILIVILAVFARSKAVVTDHDVSARTDSRVHRHGDSLVLEDARDTFEEDFAFPDITGLPDDRIMSSHNRQGPVMEEHVEESVSDEEISSSGDFPDISEEVISDTFGSGKGPDLPALDDHDASDAVLPPLDEPVPQKPGKNSSALYNEDTGLVKPVFLKERLQAEIERSAQFDEDLSLVVVGVAGQEYSSEVLKKLANIVHNHFTFHDLAFEYSGTRNRIGCAVLAPDVDLDKTSRTCALFQADCRKLGLETAIGISSRNGRIISPDSMLEEAQAAQEKALVGGAGSNKIVAFRSDPDKYRKIIST